MQFVNLTPHAIHLFASNGSGRIFPPSGNTARVSTIETDNPSIDGIEIIHQEFGPVENLPEPSDGVYFIVSAIVKAALPDREDLLVPARHIRDPQGQVIGCRAFSQ